MGHSYGTFWEIPKRVMWEKGKIYILAHIMGTPCYKNSIWGSLDKENMVIGCDGWVGKEINLPGRCLSYGLGIHLALLVAAEPECSCRFRMLSKKLSQKAEPEWHIKHVTMTMKALPLYLHLTALLGPHPFWKCLHFSINMEMKLLPLAKLSVCMLFSLPSNCHISDKQSVVVYSMWNIPLKVEWFRMKRKFS